MIIQAGWLKVLNIFIINLNFLHPWMFCLKFDSYWPSRSGQKFYKHQFIFAISLSFPLGNEHDPSFDKLEFPIPYDALCQVWLKLEE